MTAKSFFGIDGFVWSYGVVEDRKDPLFLGRCKVRWFGWHTDDKVKIPTEDLPWATPTAPLDPGRAHAVGPKEGDWIFGFFRDGVRAQQPVMVGVMLGIPEKAANPSIGFNDPRPDSVLAGHQVPRDPDHIDLFFDGSGGDIEEIDPKSRFPDTRFLFESDLSRFERGVTDPDSKIDKTIVQHKRDTIDTGAQQANDMSGMGISAGGHPRGTGSDQPSPAPVWVEPETPYAAEYPYNHAYYSESGHLVEIDDTPNVERLHWYHRSGTFQEIHPTGLRVNKIVDKDYHIVLESFFEHIEANSWETVDWGKKTFVNRDKKYGCHYDITVGANSNLNITTEKGELNIYVNGDCNLGCNGNVNITCAKDLVAQVGRNANVKVGTEKNPGNMVTEVFGDYEMHVHGNYKVMIDKNEYREVGVVCGAPIGSGGNQTITLGSNYVRNTYGTVTDWSAMTYKRSCNLDILDDSLLSIARNAPTVTDTAQGGLIQQISAAHKLNSDTVSIDCTNMERNCTTIIDTGTSSFDIISSGMLNLNGELVQIVGQNIKSIASQENIASGKFVYRHGIVIGDRANLIAFDSIPIGSAPTPFPIASYDMPVIPNVNDGFIILTGRMHQEILKPGPVSPTAYMTVDVGLSAKDVTLCEGADGIFMTTLTPEMIVLNGVAH